MSESPPDQVEIVPSSVSNMKLLANLVPVFGSVMVKAAVGVHTMPVGAAWKFALEPLGPGITTAKGFFVTGKSTIVPLPR
jgi:hypothetical protein